MKDLPVLIVGAGLTGCTIARKIADDGGKVRLIDRRNHIAGNAFDFRNEMGITQHKYGPHIFHTSNEKVVAFLSRFTDWTPYKHKVKAMLQDGRLVTLPVNKTTAEIVGKQNIIDVFFRPYSEKMWGMPLEDISPDILNRVPIREDNNDLYFPNDTFQNMPTDGYASMCNAMIDSPLIELELNKSDRDEDFSKYQHVFHSGAIDEFFEFKFGRLPYRSLKFTTHHLPLPQLFPVSQLNFTHNGPHTRVVEWKNFPNHGENNCFTTVTFEEPCDYTENNDERFYPVKDKEGAYRELYKRYADFVKQEYPNITFCGRLGNYAYLDMHQAISSALKVSEGFLKQESSL